LIRSVASILAVLSAVAPGFEPKVQAAAHIQNLADVGDFDPYTLIAYVEHESRWTPSAVGVYSGVTYVGLGQLRLNNYPCKDATGFVYDCDEWRAPLLEWHFNLTETARTFMTWRGYCQEKVGSGAAKYWLQGVTGWDGKRKTTCGHKGGRPLPVPIPVVKLLKRRAALVKGYP
jgi:hypothetical protein